MKRFLILFFAVLLLFPLSAFSQDNLSKRIGSIKNSLDADTPFEAYDQLKTKMRLPKSVTPEALYEGLCAREKVLSTAV
ncbi:MAG: hypothetical protein II466_07320, partial [Bacteroidales bacterium]|nr:hypothetical protein [Bacteroidales bacterium]